MIEQGGFAPTEEGTPQGGVVSPLLLNIALHGMEEAAGVRYTRSDPHGAHVRADSPVLVRYADDFVVMCHTRDQAEQDRRRSAGRRDVDQPVPVAVQQQHRDVDVLEHRRVALAVGEHPQQRLRGGEHLGVDVGVLEALARELGVQVDDLGGTRSGSAQHSSIRSRAACRPTARRGGGAPSAGRRRAP